jgi:hypothetical protein
VWGTDESPFVSTVLFSESAPPVPCPPHNELNNQVALAMISSHLHLFCITTPINIERFHSLLASHPNQALVESVCRGLEEGFWPWAVTFHLAAPSIVDNATLQKIRNLEHLKFVREQRDEEMVL